MKRAARKAADIVARVEERIGHRFADAGRLERALTHSSLRNPSGGNYERLEFLGDRVLGLCVAELLFDHFRDASEGELSVRLNQLVSAQTCGEVADELGLHEFIRTGADVKQVTDKRMLNVRADVVESIIAAIYLDAGLEAARRFIHAHWKGRAFAEDAARRDAKTELQEWAHARFGVTPVYRVTDRSGPDHEPVFKVIVEVQGTEPATGVSRSKRAAEQAAATALLEREGVWQANAGKEDE
ncbi:ribonuclease III [Hoeflea alexandrii]